MDQILKGNLDNYCFVSGGGHVFEDLAGGWYIFTSEDESYRSISEFSISDTNLLDCLNQPVKFGSGIDQSFGNQ